MLLALSSDNGDANDGVTGFERVTLRGKSKPGAFITIEGTGLNAICDQEGNYEFQGVILGEGTNEFRVTATDRAGNSSSATRTLSRSPTGDRSNLVLEWNQVALEAVRRAAIAPPIATRGLAMLNVAMFDVINAVEATPSFLVSVTPDNPVELDAGISAAAFQALRYLYLHKKQFLLRFELRSWL